MAHRRKNPLAGINFLRYAEGGSKYQPPKKAPPPSHHERREHAGRLPQPGVPEGPRNDLDPTTVPPPLSQPTKRTPPIQTVPGVPLLTQISDFLTPGPNAKETAEAAQRLGVKPREVPEQIGDTAGDAVKAVKSGIKELASDVAAAAKLPNQHVDSFLGQKTLGTPTPNQILRAAQKGQVRTNQKGKLTLPATRQAAQRLAHLRQKAQNAGIPGLSPDEQTFVKAVSRGTGGILHPRTVAAWTHQEGGNSTGDWNRLNIGHTDSGALPLTADPRWRDPEQAGELTAAFLRGEYGGPSQGIKDILPKAKGLPPAQQLQVIAGSGWAGDPEYGPHLQSVLASTPAGQPAPGVTQKLQQAKLVAQRLGIPTQTQQQALGPPPKQVLTRFKAALVAAKQLDKLTLPYVWGGGHNAGKVQIGSGVDCSGAVSFVLQKMGVKLPGGVTSGEMGSYLEPGPGAVTVFYNGEHTFMKIGNKYFGTSHANPEGGAGFIPASYEQGEAESGKYSVAHVPGLGQKVAVQMGIDLSSATPASGGGGVVYSPDGTTATVTGGVKKDKPGFSSAPISFESVPTSPLLATGAALPAAYEQFQLGGPAPESGEGEEDIIQRILSRRRV